MRPIKNLTGRRFGRLLVINDSRKRKNGNIIWRCICDCGKLTMVIGNNLTNRNTKSCGCLRKDAMRKTGYKHGESHGRSKTRLYMVWCGMKARCYGKNHRYYKYYGGQGIKVCASWHNYMPFRNWALASGYQENLTIDRINPDGNYEPDNCQWISKPENTKKRHIERRQKNENHINVV